MSDDLDVFAAAHGYLTAHHFTRDALRPRAAHLVDVLCAGKGYHQPTSWAEDAEGNAAAFMVWAAPVVLEALRAHPPEALINEVRVVLVARSFRVCWWLFCEEMREALKARQQHQPSSMPYQRWAGVLSEYAKRMPRASAWRSREQLLTEARSRETQVALELLAESRERELRSRGSPNRLSLQERGASDGSMVPFQGVGGGSGEVLLSVTQAAARAAKAAVAGELDQLRKELDRNRNSKVTLNSQLQQRLVEAERERQQHREREQELERVLAAALAASKDVSDRDGREQYNVLREKLQMEKRKVEMLQHQMEAVRMEAETRTRSEVDMLRRELREQKVRSEQLQRAADSAYKESDAIRQAAAEGERERVRIQNLVRTARMHAAAGAAQAASGLASVQDTQYRNDALSFHSSGLGSNLGETHTASGAMLGGMQFSPPSRSGSLSPHTPRIASLSPDNDPFKTPKGDVDAETSFVSPYAFTPTRF